LNNPASIVLDSILASIEVRQGRHRIEHCDVFGQQPYVGQVSPDSSCLNADPRLRDLTHFDFRLLDTSPCRSKASDGGDIGCCPTEKAQAVWSVAARLDAGGAFR
jgi:hypothetical protein